MASLLETLRRHAGPQRAKLALVRTLLPRILELPEAEQEQVASYIARAITSPKLQDARTELLARLPAVRPRTPATPPRTLDTPPAGGRWIEEVEAIARYDIRNAAPISNFGYPRVLVHEGDLELGGMRLDAWLEDAAHANAPARLTPCLIIVDGHLRSRNLLRLPDDPNVSLLVTGDLHVAWLELGYHQAFLVQGDATIDAVVLATRTSGELHVTGALRVPYVLDNSDNIVRAGDARWRHVLYRAPRDLAPLCAELNLEDVDLGDPDSEPHERIIEILLARRDR